MHGLHENMANQANKNQGRLEVWLTGLTRNIADMDISKHN